MKTINKRLLGQTLVETAAALGIIAVVAAALITMGVASLRSSTFSKNRIRAEFIANEAMEGMRNRRNTFSFATAFNTTPPNNCYQLASAGSTTVPSSDVSCASFISYPSDSTFQYKIEAISYLNAGISGVRITVTVRFTDTGGNRDYVLESVFTNWK